jgi:hypothetical protein
VTGFARGLAQHQGGGFDVGQGFDQQISVGFVRTGQHQVGLELVVGLPGAFSALGMVRLQLDQRVELLTKIGGGWIANQTLALIALVTPAQECHPHRLLSGCDATQFDLSWTAGP